MDAGIRVEALGSVLRVVLVSPENRNAHTPATWRRLTQIADLVTDEVRVVLLTAEGPSFGAGLDRRMFTPAGIQGEDSLVSLAESSDEYVDSFIREAQQAFTWWSTCPAITIAAVQGHAIGASAQLALACDLMLVADDLQFALRETSLGLVPDLTGTWPLVSKVGYSRALEICGSGRFVGSTEAVAIGLAHSAHPASDLGAAVDARVEGFLAAPQGALRALKPLLQGASSRSPLEQQAAERAAQLPRFKEIRAMMAAAETSENKDTIHER